MYYCLTGKNPYHWAEGKAILNIEGNIRKEVLKKADFWEGIPRQEKEELQLNVNETVIEIMKNCL